MNNLQAAIPRILALGMKTLRENVVMPRLVNSDFQGAAAQKGSTVDVVLSSGVVASPVVPGMVTPTGTPVEPIRVPITLNNWVEAGFEMTDRDLAEVADGYLPVQVGEAIKSLANYVDRSIFALYKSVYGAVGTAGVTPFATTAEAQAARRLLNRQLAPPQDRYMVVDPDADAQATGLPAFQYASYAGDSDVIREGRIGRKFGFDWHMSQNVPVHTAGGATGYKVNQANHTAGSKSVAVNTGTGVAVYGDLFSVAGHDQTYVVTSVEGSPNMTRINYEPAARAAFPNNANITFVGDHVVNLAFNRFAFAFVSRPLLDVEPLGNRVLSMSDPISKLTVRLEVSRLYKQTRWSFDVLWGVACIRPELAVRVLG